MIFSDTQIDILKEIINISVGKSTGLLNKLIGKRVKLKVPSIKILSLDQLKEIINSSGKNQVSSVVMPFKGEFSGMVEMIFPTSSAITLVDLFTQEESFTDDIDILRSSALSEIGNIILNSLIGNISNMLSTRLRYSIPKYFEGSSDDIINIYDCQSDVIIYANTYFSIQNVEIQGNFIIFLEVKSIKRLLELIDDFGTKLDDE